MPMLRRRRRRRSLVPADKQKALLVEGPTALPAPLFAPDGGTARCKVAVDEQGKIAEPNSGIASTLRGRAVVSISI